MLHLEAEPRAGYLYVTLSGVLEEASASRASSSTARA
jgi:hypothetical protein